MPDILRMRRLVISAYLCLVMFAPTAFGPGLLWPVGAVAAANDHAKTRGEPDAGKLRPDRAGRLEEPADNGAAATTGVVPAETVPPPVADEPKRIFRQAAAIEIATIAPVNAAQARPRSVTGSEREAMPIPKPRPKPKPVVHRSQRDICDTLARAAESNRLPVPFFIRLLFQESRFEASVVSHAGAQGIAQFMPATAASVGLDNPFDPLQAIPAAARLLRDLLDRFGNLGLAAAAYNAGPARVHKWLKKESGLPAETHGYVKTITGHPAESWKAASGGQGEAALPRRAPCKDVSARYVASNAAHVPLPPRRPHARPARVQIAHAARSAPAKHHEAMTKTGESRRGKSTALQLAARRRGTQAGR